MVSDPGRIPGPLVIPNCVEVQLRWQLPTAKVVHNVLHGIVGGTFAPSPTIAEAIRTAITTGAGWTDYAGELNENTQLLAVALRDLRVAFAPLIESTGAAAAGTAAVKALPPEVALAVTLRTNATGQQNRGRVYLAGFDTTAMQASGAATANAMTHSQAFITHVSAAMTASGLQFAIAQPARHEYTSSRTGRVILGRLAAAVPVVSILVRDGVFDSQRRRSR